MARYVNADALIKEIKEQADDCGEVIEFKLAGYACINVIKDFPTADIREVIEADGYKHLICPHCLSEFYAKTKPEMFCPNCGKKFFFSEKWCDFPYVGENIEQGNGLP